jgi:hypothetical protein
LVITASLARARGLAAGALPSNWDAEFSQRSTQVAQEAAVYYPLYNCVQMHDFERPMVVSFLLY